MNFLKVWLDFFEDVWFHIGIEWKVKSAFPLHGCLLVNHMVFGIWQVVMFSSTCNTRKYDTQKPTCKMYFLKTSYKLWNVPF